MVNFTICTSSSFGKLRPSICGLWGFLCSMSQPYSSRLELTLTLDRLNLDRLLKSLDKLLELMVVKSD